MTTFSIKDSDGNTVKVETILGGNEKTITLINELETLMLANMLEKDFAGNVMKVKQAFKMAFRIDRYDSQLGSITSFIKKLVIDGETVNPTTAILLKDIILGITSDSQIRFTGHVALRKQDSAFSQPIRNIITGNISTLMFVDELFILFAKYSIREVVEILVAIRNVGYGVYKND